MEPEPELELFSPAPAKNSGSGSTTLLLVIFTKYFFFFTGIPKDLNWVPEEYDEIMEGTREERFGLKSKCVFNVLESFHAVGQFPLDPLHDFLEKVAACDAHTAILVLAEQGRLDIGDYNEHLSNLRLEDYEIGDGPLPINRKAEKMSGKAMSIALHLRLMPLILSILLDHDFESEFVDLLLLLAKINEYILADCFSVGDVLEFQDLVVEYFEKKRICREIHPSFRKNVPKDHFIEHYSQQILDCGPFTCIWTARCESRHRDFVNFAESSKNFINILKTLSDKNQKKVASRFYRGFFSEPEVQFPSKKYTSAECGHSLPRDMFHKNDVLTDKIIVKNTLYKVGHLVVRRVESDNVIEVGKILKIVVRNSEVLLLMTRFECARTRFNYFDAHPLDIVLESYSTVCDFKPLICRAVEECPRFLLHHHIPAQLSHLRT